MAVQIQKERKRKKSQQQSGFSLDKTPEKDLGWNENIYLKWSKCAGVTSPATSVFTVMSLASGLALYARLKPEVQKIRNLDY